MLINKKTIPKTLQILRKKGIYRTGWLFIDIISDRFFDFYYHIDTASRAPLSDLIIEGKNKCHAIDYEATYPFPFNKMLRRLNFPKHFITLDVGCGKGRIPILFASFGFKQSIGLEFSKKLCEIAIANKAGFRNGQFDSRIQIIHTDVLNYPMKDTENIFYFFNPFDHIVLSQFIQNIIVSHKRACRPIFIIFHNMPCSRILLEGSKFFSIYTHFVYGSIEFTVYGNEKAITDRRSTIKG